MPFIYNFVGVSRLFVFTATGNNNRYFLPALWDNEGESFTGSGNNATVVGLLPFFIQFVTYFYEHFLPFSHFTAHRRRVGIICIYFIPFHKHAKYPHHPEHKAYA